MNNTTTENSTPSTPKKPSHIKNFVFGVFGVLLPCVTLFVELTTGLSAQHFFDPIPSLWHVLAIALVPLTNLGVLVLLNKRRVTHYRTWSTLLGIVIGVSLFYSAAYLPSTPIAILLLMTGFGFLLLAPLFSLWMSISLYFRLRKHKPQTQKRFSSPIWGMGIGILLIFTPQIPYALTYHGMQLATANNQQEQIRGIDFLRAFGSEDLLLRLAHGYAGRSIGLTNFMRLYGHERYNDINEKSARIIYYRVTGRLYNSVPAPKMSLADLNANGWRFNNDPDQGGEEVGNDQSRLHLRSSKLDASIDGNAALAYVEWTWEVHNADSRMAEARAQIELPPGGMVSRATLWVDGEEREAAFAGKAKVRQAYERIVRQQRDPLLVTQAGPEQVLVQMFPVLPNNTMKIRIGITAPLILDNSDQARYRLPRIISRNFSVAPDFKHQVWLESKSPISSANTLYTHAISKTQVHSLRGALDNNSLQKSESIIRIQRPANILQVKATDTRDPNIGDIVQEIQQTRNAITGIVLVIDGSISMRSHTAGLMDFVKTLPTGIHFSMVIAGDSVIEAVGPTVSSTANTYTQAIRALRYFDYRGGADNSQALARAYQLSANEPGHIVFWIHGPQPLASAGIVEFEQLWARRPDSAPLYSFSVFPSSNQILKSLHDKAKILIVARFSNVATDLQRQLAIWKAGPQWITQRHRVSHKEQTASHNEMTTTSDHLVRLWAADEIHKLARLSTSDSHQQAIELASRYQLVTSVSGAVALETQQQYDQAGLKPMAKGTVPAVPEPETWVLIFVSLMLLSFLWWRRKQTSTGMIA